jgi:hypothetical protein
MRVILALACVACGAKDSTVAEALAPSLAATAAAIEAAAAVPDAAPAELPPLPEVAATARPSRPRLTLKLRSTPSGAAATVDGRLVGVTPTRVDLEDDGRAHDFTFVLSGHETWRLRFAPSHAGVIHATLRESVGADAGPR